MLSYDMAPPASTVAFVCTVKVVVSLVVTVNTLFERTNKLAKIRWVVLWLAAVAPPLTVRS